MNWEESKACTPLKRDFLRSWFSQEKRFFLTGGSALGIFFLEHRMSYDLDLFTSEEVSGIDVQRLVHRVATAVGAECVNLLSTPDYFRFRLSRETERELIDIVIDRIPQLDEIKLEIENVRVDTLREMVANKLATLVSRSEIKDIVDLYFLEAAGCNLLNAIPDAQAKDGGWEPAVVAMLLGSIKIHESPTWMIRDVKIEELQTFVNRLRLAIAALALPQ
jgi:hypothetical protein